MLRDEVYKRAKNKKHAATQPFLCEETRARYEQAIRKEGAAWGRRLGLPKVRLFYS